MLRAYQRGPSPFDPRSANGGWESANGGKIKALMEPYEQEQYRELDRRLAEAEKKLLATANLVRAGIPMVTSQQMRIDALIDSDARLYLHLQQVDERLARMAESQQRTDESLARMAESLQRTDESLARMAESQKRTDEKLVHLADSVQKLVDSWKAGGNGAH
jgi:chromosome segregation ATPase